MSRGSTLAKIGLAWLPFWLLWVFFMMVYGGSELGSAAVSGLVVIGVAAVLGLGVWRFTGVYEWPERLRLSFYAVHLAVGTVYASLWLLAETVYHAVVLGVSPIELLGESEVLGWVLLMGLWLYGLVAGVSYSVRNRERFREQQKIAARAETLAAQARLEALRAQLNPHFLFNALHSFSALIRHDPGAAERAVERLGDLLRYALDEGQDEVTLEDEWRFTQHYLDLERLRLENRLRVEAEFDVDALECKVPSFTLQPLVENAIQHSIAPRPRGGEVRIVGRLRGDRVLVRVSDDGPGGGAAATKGGNGLGLSILEQRLKALYGDRAELRIETGSGEGFSVTVTLPRWAGVGPRPGGGEGS